MSAKSANDQIWYDAEAPVSIIIVNFKNIPDLTGCLSSVCTNNLRTQIELI